MDWKEIDDVVVEIMIRDGGDGHCDGHEVMTDFIVALLRNRGEEWVKKYESDSD